MTEHDTNPEDKSRTDKSGEVSVLALAAQHQEDRLLQFGRDVRLTVIRSAMKRGKADY
jgi:hypothetical protein